MSVSSVSEIVPAFQDRETITVFAVGELSVGHLQR